MNKLLLKCYQTTPAANSSQTKPVMSV